MAMVDDYFPKMNIFVITMQKVYLLVKVRTLSKYNPRSFVLRVAATINLGFKNTKLNINVNINLNTFIINGA